jgi:hypothetical protein
MHFSLRTALLLLATTSVAAGACGGNVVVDTPTSGAGNGGMGGGATTTTTGFDNSATTGTVFDTSSSSSTATGFGATTTTGTGFGGDTSVSVSVSTSTAVSSTGTGVGGGACAGLDLKILATQPLYPTMVTCAQQNLGNPGGQTMCLAADSGGLSTGCVACVAGDLDCSLMSCLAQCATGPNSAGCLMCRENNCAAPWVVCSGVVEAPGSTTCEIALVAGTKGMGWQRGLPAEAFVTAVGYETYQAMDQCACGGTAGGCAGVCSAMTPIDFCTGSVASPMCLMCLESTCGAPFMKCAAN